MVTAETIQTEDTATHENCYGGEGERIHLQKIKSLHGSPSNFHKNEFLVSPVVALLCCLGSKQVVRPYMPSDSLLPFLVFSRVASRNVSRSVSSYVELHHLSVNIDSLLCSRLIECMRAAAPRMRRWLRRPPARGCGPEQVGGTKRRARCSGQSLESWAWRRSA